MDEFYHIIAIAIIICFFIAELFGRSKHIGRWWSFFLLLGGLLPGIIAIILSPSAKKQPTRGGKTYNIWCWISLAFGILNLIQLYNTEGQQGQLFFCFFILSFYLFELSKGEVINKKPKYYFQIPNPISNNDKNVEKKEKPKKDLKGIIENLKELREDGLLSDLEYETKLNNVINEQNKDIVSESEEFLKLKKLFNAGILDNAEFEDKTKILIERQSIEKKDTKDADLKIVPQSLNNPTKEFQFKNSTPPKQDNSWRNFIIFIAIFIGLTILIGNSGVLKKPELKEESYPMESIPPAVTEDTSTVTEPVSTEVQTDTTTIDIDQSLKNIEEIKKFNGGYVIDKIEEYEYNYNTSNWVLLDKTENYGELYLDDSYIAFTKPSFNKRWKYTKWKYESFDKKDNNYVANDNYGNKIFFDVNFRKITWWCNLKKNFYSIAFVYHVKEKSDLVIPPDMKPQQEKVNSQEATSKNNNRYKKASYYSPITSEPTMDDKKTVIRVEHGDVFIIEKYNEKYYKVKYKNKIGYIFVGWILE